MQMERTVRIFHSFDEAEQADRVAWAAMTPQERLDYALDLAARYREGLGEAGQGFARVCRIIELPER